jgi:hypothetical protein
MAHHVAFIGILQAVVEHVVEDFLVPHAVAPAGLGQQVRGVGHGFQTARDDDAGTARSDEVMAEHEGLHAGAAHLVDRRTRHTLRQARAQGGLASGRLAEPGGEYATHQHAADIARLDARLGDGGGNGRGTQFGRTDIRQCTLEGADGSALCGDDYDRIVTH